MPPRASKKAPPPYGYLWQYTVEDAISLVRDFDQLTRMQEIVLLHLLLHTNSETGRVQMSVRRLAEVMRTSQSEVIRHLDTLIAAKVLLIEQDDKRTARVLAWDVDAIRARRSVTKRPGFRNERCSRLAGASTPEERSRVAGAPSEGASAPAPTGKCSSADGEVLQPGQGSAPAPLEQEVVSREAVKRDSLSRVSSPPPRLASIATASPSATAVDVDAIDEELTAAHPYAEFLVSVHEHLDVDTLIASLCTAPVAKGLSEAKVRQIAAWAIGRRR